MERRSQKEVKSGPKSSLKWVW